MRFRNSLSTYISLLLMFYLSILHFRQRKHFVGQVSLLAFFINVIVHIFTILLMLLIYNYLFNSFWYVITLIFTRKEPKEDQIVRLWPFFFMIDCEHFSFRSSSFPFRRLGIGIDHMKYNKILALTESYGCYVKIFNIL